MISESIEAMSDKFDIDWNQPTIFEGKVTLEWIVYDFLKVEYRHHSYLIQ